MNKKMTQTENCIIPPSEMLSRPGLAYIYTDLVSHQYVGNVTAPLLRVVHLTAKVVTFPNVHYLPLSKSEICSIRIYIKDVEGKAFRFTPGSLICKMHVRRKRYY